MSAAFGLRPCNEPAKNQPKGAQTRRNRLQQFLHKGGNTMADPSYEELKAENVELKKQLAAAGGGNGALHFKVAAKGGVSAYGLGRYPVTLYYEQWHKLLGGVEPLRAFLEANKDALKLRSPKPDSC
jgi:hypothetical protein